MYSIYLKSKNKCALLVDNIFAHLIFIVFNTTFNMTVRVLSMWFMDRTQ